MSASISLDNDRLQLGGELDHASAEPLRRQAAILLRGAAQATLELDCSAVTRANSAGLALLLAILRDAAQLDKTISIRHLPADMRQMAHVCELTAILQPATETR